MLSIANDIVHCCIYNEWSIKTGPRHDTSDSKPYCYLTSNYYSSTTGKSLKVEE